MHRLPYREWPHKYQATWFLIVPQNLDKIDGLRNLWWQGQRSSSLNRSFGEGSRFAQSVILRAVEDGTIHLLV